MGKYEIFELSRVKWADNSHINYLEGDFSDDESRFKVVFNKIKFLKTDYPNFEEWYFDKVIPGLLKLEREILICIVNESNTFKLGGIAILKCTEVEKKICTLRVTPEYEKNGVGHALFERAFNILGTRKPIFTVTEEKLEMFKKHIIKYEFKKIETLGDYYVKGKNEHVFNDFLSK